MDNKIYSIVIRQADQGDHNSILLLHEEAFKQPNEAFLVDKLIKMNLDLPELSLIAEHKSKVVGHILMSIACLDNDAGKPVIALAPLAVLPEYQKKGIGSALCKKSLELAEQTEYGAVVCLGSPQYYPRFGFETASRYGILSPFDAPDEDFMVYRLPKWNETLKGMVTYSPPFDEV